MKAKVYIVPRFDSPILPQTVFHISDMEIIDDLLILVGAETGHRTFIMLDLVAAINVVEEKSEKVVH